MMSGLGETPDSGFATLGPMDGPLAVTASVAPRYVLVCQTASASPARVTNRT